MVLKRLFSLCVCVIFALVSLSRADNEQSKKRNSAVTKTSQPDIAGKSDVKKPSTKTDAAKPPAEKADAAKKADAKQKKPPAKKSTRPPKPPAFISKFPASLRKPAPESVEELIAIQNRVQQVVKKVMKCTVNVRVGGGQGSGVIVTKDGYVLTAAHVSASPGKRITLVFPDGKTVRGRTLGLNHAADAGLVKITDEGEWPFAELGSDEGVKKGDWCVSLGHPGGYHRGRNPVVRLGRVVIKKETMLQSDCTLVGGDSGGPLFDLDGRVIGIHSRIGPSNTWNFHVPIGAFHKDWDRFVSEDNFGQPPKPGGPILGVGGADDPKGARITGVAPGLPAEAAGLKVGDVISKFEGKAVKGFGGLFELVQQKKPGDKVAVEIIRDGKTLKKSIVLASRG